MKVPDVGGCGEAGSVLLIVVLRLLEAGMEAIGLNGSAMFS